MATQPQPDVVMLCIVTNGRHEASLGCAVSLLRLQTALMTNPERIRADMHFVPTLDDALNLLHRDAEAKSACIVDCTVGFDADFLFRARRSGLPLVLGVHPLPLVDWERVKRQPADESPQFWGNVYNVKPTGAARDGYAKVTASKVGLVWVTKDAVARIAREHPELASADGTYVQFAVPGLQDGVRVDGDERFLKLYGDELWADIERPAASSGPLEFGGCVGARDVLR